MLASLVAILTDMLVKLAVLFRRYLVPIESVLLDRGRIIISARPSTTSTTDGDSPSKLLENRKCAGRVIGSADCRRDLPALGLGGEVGRGRGRGPLARGIVAKNVWGKSPGSVPRVRG